MTMHEILGILGYVAAYLAVGIGLSPLVVKVERGITASAFGGEPHPPPEPWLIGLLVLAWWVPVGIWALSRAWSAAAGLVTGLGRLACWLAGAEGERAAGLRWIAEGEWKCSCGQTAYVHPKEMPSDVYARYVAEKEREHAGCRVVSATFKARNLLYDPADEIERLNGELAAARAEGRANADLADRVAES